MHTDLGEHDEIPVSVFFRTPDNFFPFEQAALALCRGVVLDVGAGAGVRTLLKPGGQILLDSASPRRRSSQDEAPELEWPERMSDYLGEAWVRLEYKGQIGPPFQELYVDYRTMADRAAPAGLAWDRVFSGDEESYVVRLVRK